MGKALAIGESLVIFKELFEGAEDFFSKLVPDNFFKLMDKLAFLNSKFLAIGSNGVVLDNTKKIAEAIMNLSNFVIWGILLFVAFKSLFGYFLSKTFDMPWKVFIRIIVFGVLANASFFICYTGIFFAENCTEYIRNYVGEKKVSFECLEEFINEDCLEEIEEDYTFKALVSVFMYFSILFTSIILSARYIFIKVLILFSPIFFILGGFKESEKIFFCWCKKFIFLLFLQLFLAVSLGIVNLCNLDGELVTEILLCAMLFLVCKNICRFLNFSY